MSLSSDPPEASNVSGNLSTMSPPSDPPEASQVSERRFETRQIHFRGHLRHILYQDANGPCALLAICNSLLLADKIRLDNTNDMGEVSENYLFCLLEAYITMNQPNLMQDISMQLYLRKALMLFVNPIPVNVNFTSTRTFGDPGNEEFVVVGIFQLFDVPLFHGWVVDPQDLALSEALDNKSHDFLMAAHGEYMSKMQGSLDFSAVDHAKWNLILEFLHGNSLTSHGLSCLREDVKEQEIGVLFCHNHFSTMMKYNEELYLLQTDVGFLTTDVVWLRLDEVNYSSDYMTCCFIPLGKEVSMTISAGENETFLPGLLLNLRALIAHHTPTRIGPFFQLVGKIILAESDDTKREGYLNTLTGELEQQEVCTFYQSVIKMIQAEPDNTNSEEYLKRLMSFFNQELVMDLLPSDPPEANQVSERRYKTRQIHFEGRLTHIVCQDANGPCAFLGICNSLLLTDKIRLDISNDMGEVSENYLLSLLMAHVSTSHPDLMQDISVQTFVREELMSFANETPVNVNFMSTRAFGETGEHVAVVRIFNLSGVSLFHGWVVDPQDMALSEALDNKSHDFLMVALGKYMSKMEGGLDFSAVDRAKWDLIHEFLHGNSLTSHGLSCLREDMKEQEICVLFWHNHFSTMMKYDGELYLLQTDVGFLTTDTVWQRLSEVNGSAEYMTCCFTPVVKEVSTTMFASENKPLNLELLLNLRALIAHHMPNRINTFFQLVGKIILGESDNTRREWYLNKLMAELEQHEIHIFYQSACEMIRAESDNTNSGKYLKRLMSLSNEKLAEIIAAEGQIIDICKEDIALSVISILQTNTCVANSLGPQFFPQISHIFSDMLTVYSLCSKLISKQLIDEGSEDGPFASELQCLRSVKMEILKLMETFVVKAEDLPQLQKQFVLPLVDSVLCDYNRDTIEHGALSLFSTIIIKFPSEMLEEVSRIFDAVFQYTPEINKKPEHCFNLFCLLHVIGTHCFQVLTDNSCERLNHVMDYIIWALQQREINIVETVLSLLLDVLQNVQASGFQNQFYKTNLLRIEQTILTVLMGTPNISCSELHVSVLQHLFNAVDVLTEPLISSTQCNMMPVRDCTIKFLSSTFPGTTNKMAQKFVDGLFNSKGDDTDFLNLTREFLVRSKETCTQVPQERKSVDGPFSPRSDLADLRSHTRDSTEPSVQVSLPLAQTAPLSGTTCIIPFGTHETDLTGVTSKWKPRTFGTHETDLTGDESNWTVVISKRTARRFKKSDSSSGTALESLASPASASVLLPSAANAGTSSMVPFTEFIKLPGNEITGKHTIFSGVNSMEVDETTWLGRRAATSYLHGMTSAHASGNSWNGTFELRDFVVLDGSEFMIWKPTAGHCTAEALQKDYVKFASQFIPLFGEAALFRSLANSLTNFRPRYFTRDLFRKFRFFMMTHLSIKPPMIRSFFFTELSRIHRFLSKEGRNALSAALRGFPAQLSDWRQLVKQNPFLLKVYNYKEEKKKEKEKKKKQPQEPPKVDAEKLRNYGDLVYNPSLESLLTFIRNAIQHVGDSKEDGKAKIKRLVEIDLLLCQILYQMPLILQQLIFSPCMTEEVSVMLNDLWELLLVTEGMTIERSLFDT